MTELLDRLTGETTELLQAMIRNQCVNDGTPESGHEDRNAFLLRDELEGSGVAMELFEVLPGRSSIVARHPGTDPSAPALMLMGHTDVVPVSPEGWKVDPFGGELIGDEVWGRGAVDMLNVTSSMAVVFRHIVSSGLRYPGDIVYFGVADEEAGGSTGPNLLSNSNGIRFAATMYSPNTGEPRSSEPTRRSCCSRLPKKGSVLADCSSTGRRVMVRCRTQPTTRSARPPRSSAASRPTTPVHVSTKLFEGRVRSQNLPSELEARLLDPARIDDALAEMDPSLARNLHSCCHTSFSNNVIHGGTKTNVIPDQVMLEVDIRILPGETTEDVEGHLLAAIGPQLMASVDVEVIHDGRSTQSSTDTPLWSALVDSIQMSYPGAKVMPSMVTGGTDARFFRHRGIPAFGAGLLSTKVGIGEFMSRFHGHNERIDIESLRLTTKLWLDVVDDSGPLLVRV